MASKPQLRNLKWPSISLAGVLSLEMVLPICLARSPVKELIQEADLRKLKLFSFPPLLFVHGFSR